PEYDPRLVALIWAVTGTDLAVDCYKDPTTKGCGEALAMLIPGAVEIKALKDISEAKRILEGSRAARAASGGFKYGVSPEEIAKLNRSFGGSGSPVRGTIENTMLNAQRYSSFYDKVAVVIR
ncbi:hypothetical protein, partial [Streptomyces sp. MUSC 14]|uniref:hypothetical protein n=1 Tax=Streptomyces sp. MUSC 14 TaxID=1354889 RepID=UPI0015A6BD60